MNFRKLRLMIGALLVCVLLFPRLGFAAPQAGSGQAQITASAVISSMLSRYYSAPQLSGTIIHTVQALGKSQTITTTLQMKRPALIYLDQVRTAPDPKEWLLVSDGTMFSYPVPPGVLLFNDQSKTLVEPIKTITGKVQTIQDLLQASSDSLGDVSDPITIMLGWRDAQSAMIQRWSNLQIKAVQAKDGSKNYFISGVYTNKNLGVVQGPFSMTVSPTYDLLHFEIQRSYAVGDGSSGQQSAVTTLDSWDCNVALDGKIDPTLFKVTK